MPWWTFGLGRKPPEVPRSALTSAYGKAMTAAAVSIPGPQTQLLRQTEGWQNEAWDYYDSSGEFRYAVEWEADMLSRVRLFAAELIPGEDEPVRLESGLAVDLMTAFGGGAGGQAQILSRLGTQLSVPGEGYLIGETINGVERWSVRSVDEVREAHGRYEVVDEHATSLKWRPIQDGMPPIRVFRPHKRWGYRADSPARAARGALRELELVNRHITSQYLSRLASAGVLLFPDEIAFPVKEEFAEANDPFMAEWIEIAAAAIREPGTASAVVPIPIRVPGEWLDKIKHIDFTLQLDEKIIDKRDSAIRKLATQVNVPAEILLGMGAVNHWGAWQLEEGALKTVIAPDAELISQAVSLNYLQPRLKASGESDVGRIVVWYDMSELTLRPDRSGDAFQAYDRLEINGTALRREAGFDESDKPTDEDLKEQALKIIIKTLPSGAGSALSELIGEQVTIAPTAPLQPGESTAPEPASEPAPEQAEPQTQAVPPPAPDEGLAAARTERMIRQAQAPHAIRFTMGGRWELLHPAVCEKHAYSCPYTHASLSLKSMAYPGRSGLYECSLDTFGRFRVGDFSPQRDVTRALITEGGR